CVASMTFKRGFKQYKEEAAKAKKKNEGSVKDARVRMRASTVPTTVKMIGGGVTKSDAVVGTKFPKDGEKRIIPNDVVNPKPKPNPSNSPTKKPRGLVLRCGHFSDYTPNGWTEFTCSHGECMSHELIAHLS
ncbi:hypothetical protein PFISCL1PPCAC_27855, partial [Pristionchus fissidentatus]